jgi:hypothetical protein
MENIQKSEQVAVLIDWQVKLSQGGEVIEVNPMSLDPERIRFKPIYTETGALTIIVPAVSEEAAEEKAREIARHIDSVGLWGTEIWNLNGFLASIERLL